MLTAVSPGALVKPLNLGPPPTATVAANLWLRDQHFDWSKGKDPTNFKKHFTKKLQPKIEKKFPGAKVSYKSTLKRINGAVSWDGVPGRPLAVQKAEAYSANIDARSKQVGKGSKKLRETTDSIYTYYRAAGAHFSSPSAFRTLHRRTQQQVAAVDSGLSQKTAIPTSKARQDACHSAAIGGFHSDVASLLEKNPGLKHNPMAWWCFDESPLPMQPEKFELNRNTVYADRDLAVKLGQAIRTDVGRAGSSRVSLVQVAGAGGWMLDPAFYVQGKRVQPSWTAGPYPKGLNRESVAHLTTLPSDCGVATIDLTVQMLRIKVKEIRNFPTTYGKPAYEGLLVMMMDAPSSHGHGKDGWVLALLNLAKELNLVLLPLPANTSMALDPLDLTIFGRLKALIYRFTASINAIYASGSTLQLSSRSTDLLATHRTIEGHAPMDARFRAGGFEHDYSPRTWILAIAWLLNTQEWRDVSAPCNCCYPCAPGFPPPGKPQPNPQNKTKKE